MNYYQARPLKDNSGWHFTKMRDGHVWKIGYCVDHAPHPTKEEAEACYAKYLLEKCCRYAEMCDQQLKCRECGRWTSKFVEIDHSEIIVLCDEHSNPEFVRKHWDPPTGIISSW